MTNNQPAYKTFKDFFNSEMQKQNVAFQVDLDVLQPDTQCVTEIAGYELKTINNLTAIEQMFLGIVEEQKEVANRETQARLLGLTTILRVSFPQLTLNDAIMGLYSPGTCEIDYTEDMGILKDVKPTKKGDSITVMLGNTQKYQQFAADNIEAMNDLKNKIGNQTGTLMNEWLIVTFFMITRYSNDWTLGKTGILTPDQIQEVLDFVALETNKGVKPTMEDLEALTTGEDQDDLGNEKAT